MRTLMSLLLPLAVGVTPQLAQAQTPEPVPAPSPYVAPAPAPEPAEELEGDRNPDGDADVAAEHGGGGHGGAGYRGRHHRTERGERAALRPEGRALGIGAGWTFPTDLQAPNTTSVRFRLPSGLTLEPTIIVGAGGQSQDPGDSSSSAFQMTLGGLARVPVASRGRVDLVFLAGGAVNFGTNNPDGPENDTSVFGLDLNWGLAVEYWFGPHVTLSMNALNPFASYTHSSTESPVIDDTERQDWRVGAIFDPFVSTMIHVFW